MSGDNEASVKNIMSRTVKLDWEDTTKHGVETYSLAMVSDRLFDLENKLSNELNQLKEDQKKAAYLQKLLRAINMATDSKGSVDFSNQPEIQEMFSKAKDLGAMIDETKMTYNSDERERLLENIRTTNEGITTSNELKFQVVTRYYQERLEAYQAARMISKKADEDKTNKARAISGR